MGIQRVPGSAWEVKEGFLGGQGGLSGGGDITTEMQSEGEKKCWKSVPGRRNSMCSGLEARKLGQFRKLKFPSWERESRLKKGNIFR